MMARALISRCGFRVLNLALMAGTIAPPLLAHAQTNALASQSAGQPLLAYDVVAIKPHPPDGSAGSAWRTTDDGFSASNMTVASLIFNAYDLKIGSQLSGLPNWAHSDGFDIEAKMDDDAVAALRKLDKKESATERRRMLQKLLADRFQLVVHHESKELPIYDLTVTKNGPKLKAAPADEKAGWSMTVGGRNGRLTANSVDIAGLADALCNQLGRVVLDKTGIAGNYDLTLKWTPDGAEETADSGPSIFAALEEQLGLKLLSAKGPVDTIVVDHVEKPSPN